MNINLTNSDVQAALAAYVSGQGFVQEVESIEITVGRRKKGDPDAKAEVSAVVNFVDTIPLPNGATVPSEGVFSQ